MPELPEVEAARRLIDVVKGKRIVQATIADDEKVIQGILPADLQRQLEGCRVTETHRKGKHMWLEMEDGKPSLMFHFGMTGAMLVRGVGASKYKRFEVDDEQWPPRFWKVMLELEGGLHLAFTDARRFARVQFVEDPASHPPLNKMGPDCLLEMPDGAGLAALLSKKRGVIKSVLMDQAVLAGIGNWVADEVLYQAGVHPEQPANSLGQGEVDRLRAAIVEVCETAVEAGADSSQFPSDWIFHGRWSKGQSVSVAGHKIQFTEVGGRTTAFVPALQQLHGAATAKKKKKKKGESDSEEEEEEEGRLGVGGPSSAKANKVGDSSSAKAKKAAPRRRKGEKQEEGPEGHAEAALEAGGEGTVAVAEAGEAMAAPPAVPKKRGRPKKAAAENSAAAGATAGEEEEASAAAASLVAAAPAKKRGRPKKASAAADGDAAAAVEGEAKPKAKRGRPKKQQQAVELQADADADAVQQGRSSAAGAEQQQDALPQLRLDLPPAITMDEQQQPQQLLLPLQLDCAMQQRMRHAELAAAELLQQRQHRHASSDSSGIGEAHDALPAAAAVLPALQRCTLDPVVRGLASLRLPERDDGTPWQAQQQQQVWQQGHADGSSRDGDRAGRGVMMMSDAAAEARGLAKALVELAAVQPHLLAPAAAALQARLAAPEGPASPPASPRAARVVLHRRAPGLVPQMMTAAAGGGGMGLLTSVVAQRSWLNSGPFPSGAAWASVAATAGRTMMSHPRQQQQHQHHGVGRVAVAVTSPVSAAAVRQQQSRPATGVAAHHTFPSSSLPFSSSLRPVSVAVHGGGAFGRLRAGAAGVSPRSSSSFWGLAPSFSATLCCQPRVVGSRAGGTRGSSAFASAALGFAKSLFSK